jgi:hypothetical protein
MQYPGLSNIRRQKFEEKGQSSTLYQLGQGYEARRQFEAARAAKEFLSAANAAVEKDKTKEKYWDSARARYLLTYIRACGGQIGQLQGFFWKGSPDDSGVIFIGPDGTRYDSRKAVALALGLQPISPQAAKRFCQKLLSSKRPPPDDSSSTVPAKRPVHPGSATLAPPGPVYTNEHGEGVYRVECLLAVRPSGTTREFLVRWDGWGADADSWEPESSILDKGMVRMFDRQKAQQRGSRTRPRPFSSLDMQVHPTSAGMLSAGSHGDAWPAKAPRIGQKYQSSISRCDEATPPEASEPIRVTYHELERDAAAGTAALLTAAAFGPLGVWTFIAPSNCGLGLFARASLKVGQCVSEYGGPRLPIDSAAARERITDDEYCLTIPGSRFILDGASRNSPFVCPPSPAIFANHSSRPNARLETWPVSQPRKWEVRQHMMLVASEMIPVGGACSSTFELSLLAPSSAAPYLMCMKHVGEIRIDYEDGAEEGHGYWRGKAPSETNWRAFRVLPPPPTAEEPVIDRLAELQEACEALIRASRFLHRCSSTMHIPRRCILLAEQVLTPSRHSGVRQTSTCMRRASDDE